MKKVNIQELKTLVIQDRHAKTLLKQAVEEIETQRQTLQTLYDRRALVVSKLAQIDKITQNGGDCVKKMTMIKTVCQSYFG